MIAIGVPAEGADEPRIGLTPETVKKLTAAGKHVVLIESGAGVRASIPDEQYVSAGAVLTGPAAAP